MHSEYRVSIVQATSMNAWSAIYDAEEMLGAGRIECHQGTVWNSQRKGPVPPPLTSRHSTWDMEWKGAKFGGSRILSNSGVLSASLARRERDDKSKRARITQLRPKLGI